MAEETLFGRILKGEIPSAPVYSDEDFYAFRDIHPAAPTHV
ncbi:MAG TPA: HIT domain-containing protein, partial [Candidatus Hydrogenedentes bacterium]|nr:HIT domain-containing protein [Candidatus Hydrogenedentota bacterium]